MKMSLSDLQKEMIRYRAEHRMTQTDLADACGVSLQTICNVENGVQTPSKMTEAKIRLVIGKEV